MDHCFEQTTRPIPLVTREGSSEVVGDYDMLRVELSALYAYSPYHHVIDGTKYPSLLMETGDNDPRGRILAIP